jgi:oxygen-dependent protoporphyrinogen oxidase
MKHIAIIGGGISGLSAAFALEQARQSGAEIQYDLFEAGPRLGGVIRTEEVDGCIVEAGPDSFLSEKPWAADLCRELAIGDQLIASNDAERKTYILVKGRLVPIPDGLMFMVPTKILPVMLSPMFSLGTKLRMAREWFHPPQKGVSDETVASLVARHYGQEMVERLADPLLAGVYGGSASELSVRAVLPRFADMEAKHGSLARAMLATRKSMKSMAKNRVKAATPPRPLFTSLKNGMQQITDAIVQRLPVESLHCNTPVTQIQPRDVGWLVAHQQEERFDAVILAVPAHAAGGIVQAASPPLAAELKNIGYSSSLTVALGYDGQVRSALPPGFGFLIPRSEGHRILAVTFVHNKFPYRAPPDRALLRCFLGGSGDEAVLALSDAKVLETVKKEIAEILGLRAEPRFTRVQRWRCSMAQYGVGHLDRVERLNGLQEQLPGLALAGNAYRGIGVPDCVREGRDATARVLRHS